MKLTSKDYGTILKHYKAKLPKTRKKRKQIVEKKLASKMCKCIKSVEKSNQNLDESGAIAICNNSIFKRRGLKYNRISCKKGYKFGAISLCVIRLLGSTVNSRRIRSFTAGERVASISGR